MVLSASHVASPARVPTWAVVDGRPDPAQLHTVLAPIIERVDPDLIVVFGSAARGSMTPKSDVDLLVVKNVEDLSALRVATLGALSSGHPPVDIVPATLSLLERYSESLSWVYRLAVVEGLVAYERDRVVRFGSRHARDLLVRAPETAAARMVRLLKYQKEEASAWLDKAREDLTAVNSTDQGLAVPVRCYCAQAAAEKALEALLVAHGRLVPRDHGLLELAEAVRQTGERLPAAVTDDKLARLTAYSGPAQYPGWSGETTAVDLRDFSQLANAIHDHVDRRIADILQERASSA